MLNNPTSHPFPGTGINYPGTGIPQLETVSGIPMMGTVKNFAYGWTAAGLNQCLTDRLQFITQYEQLKCPNDTIPPVVSLTPPYVYTSFIPSSLLSPDGVQTPPLVPSILIECHQGEVELPKNTYVISVRLLLSLWDDDPSYSAYIDSQHLTEKIFLELLKERSLEKRYNLIGKPLWKMIPSKRSEYYISLIELEYDLDQAPDESDNIDQWLMQDDHVSHVTITDDEIMLGLTEDNSISFD